MKNLQRYSFAIVAAASVFALGACGLTAPLAGASSAASSAATSSGASKSASAKPTESKSEESTESSKPTESSESPKSTESESSTAKPSTSSAAPVPSVAASTAAVTPNKYTKAPWAKPIVTRGEKIGTWSGNDFTIDVYQAAVFPSKTPGQYLPKTGDWVDIPVGTPLVALNFVTTYTGAAPFAMANDYPVTRVMFEGFNSYTQPMVEPGSSDDGLGIPFSGANYEYNSPYIISKGQSMANGGSYLYEAGKKVVVEGTITKVLATGKADRDNAIKIEFTTTLK